jgi:hypothetical protein
VRIALSPVMSFYSTEYHAMMMSPGPAGKESVAVTANKTAAPGEPVKSESFFHHLLDVINPLQHLPVIGTIYRAITGEHIGTVEKIAGDTLYGGMWGAIASVADVAFESITGKSFEDTVLSLFKSDDKTHLAGATVGTPAASASPPNPPAPPASDIVAANNVPDGLDVAALSTSLSAKGVNGDTANRALYAYRRSLGAYMPPPVFAGVY